MSNTPLEPPADSPPAPPSSYRAWSWVPSLYYVQGLPYTIVNVVSVPMYKTLGVANAEITFWTSWLGLIWALKALWSPFVDGVSTKRRWTVATQMAFVPTMVLAAFALGLPTFFTVSLVAFLVMSLLSATHDIAADGLYMLGLTDGQQAAFVGVRSTFWRLALISGEGGLVALAGVLGARLGTTEAGWRATLLVVAGVFAVAALYNAVVLPHAAEDVVRDPADAGRNTADIVRTFLRKQGLVLSLCFILFFRFSENHISGLVSPFLLDERAVGGLGWTLQQVGLAKGTVGVVCLVIGGILGGLAIYRHGLRAWLWPMAIALNVPNAVYWVLAAVQPDSYALGVALIGVEQFGYGFGFAAYMMFLIRFAQGPYKTAHYAFATGLMALAVWAAKFWSGAMQEALGYPAFFLWALVCALPAFVVVALTDIPADYGKGNPEEAQ